MRNKAGLLNKKNLELSFSKILGDDKDRGIVTASQLEYNKCEKHS